MTTMFSDQFTIYWDRKYPPNNMPGVFNLAMREIASDAWNAAIENCINTVGSFSDKDKSLEALGDMLVHEQETTTIEKSKTQHFLSNKNVTWEDVAGCYW